MKKNLLLFLLGLLTCSLALAKKVKFSVNMTGQTMTSAGPHISGDFQSEIGCALDFDAACTPLIQETADTNIYSVIVDIPAFQKYEYVFQYGDQSYEVENVPWESQVGFVGSFLNTNRWIYIDSLADDTTDIGAIMFSGNAPAGLTLLRFKVDMHEESTVSTNGVHIAGNFNGWNTALNYMWSFNPGMYEVINYLTPGTYEFKYFNGNASGDAEIIPGPCSVNSNREVVLNIDTILQDDVTYYPVCFGSCVACVTAGVEENDLSDVIHIYPNPVNSKFEIRNPKSEIKRIEILDALGQSIFNRQPAATSEKQISVNVSSFDSGIYFVRVTDSENRLSVSKLIIE